VPTRVFPLSVSVAVAPRHALGSALAILRADLCRHLCFHDALHQHAHRLLQEVEVSVIHALAIRSRRSMLCLAAVVLLHRVLALVRMTRWSFDSLGPSDTTSWDSTEMYVAYVDDSGDQGFSAEAHLRLNSPFPGAEWEPVEESVGLAWTSCSYGVEGPGFAVLV
jgi:hypothetical protein